MIFFIKFPSRVAPRATSQPLRPCWKINSFLSEVSVCWSCTEKIIKIERAFSVILRALPVTRRSFQHFRSFQQSPQLPTVAATSSSCCNLWKLSHICFQVPNWEVVLSHWRLSPVTAWCNYILIATLEGLKQPLWLKPPELLKQPLLVSGAAPVQCFQNCFKFKLLLRQVSSQPVTQ